MLKKSAKQQLKQTGKKQQQKRRGIDFFQAPPYRVSYAGLQVLHLYPQSRPLHFTTCHAPTAPYRPVCHCWLSTVNCAASLLCSCNIRVDSLLAVYANLRLQQGWCPTALPAACCCCCCTFILAILRLDSWCWCWDLLPTWETIRMSSAKAVRLTVWLQEGVRKEGAHRVCVTDSLTGEEVDRRTDTDTDTDSPNKGYTCVWALMGGSCLYSCAHHM